MRPLLVSCVLALATAAVSLPTSAFQTTGGDAIVIPATPPQIRAEQDALRVELQKKKGDYAHLSDDERAAILHAQEPIYALTEGKTTVDELNGDQRIALANALESVKALVNKADDARVVCERVRVVGSNMPQNKCMTVAQRRKIQERLRTEGVRVGN